MGDPYSHRSRAGITASYRVGGDPHAPRATLVNHAPRRCALAGRRFAPFRNLPFRCVLSSAAARPLVCHLLAVTRRWDTPGCTAASLLGLSKGGDDLFAEQGEVALQVRVRARDRLDVS